TSPDGLPIRNSPPAIGIISKLTSVPEIFSVYGTMYPPGTFTDRTPAGAAAAKPLTAAGSAPHTTMLLQRPTTRRPRKHEYRKIVLISTSASVFEVQEDRFRMIEWAANSKTRP